MNPLQHEYDGSYSGSDLLLVFISITRIQRKFENNNNKKQMQVQEDETMMKKKDDEKQVNEMGNYNFFQYWSLNVKSKRIRNY